MKHKAKGGSPPDNDYFAEAIGDVVFHGMPPPPVSRVAAILETDAGTYRRKAQDYSPDPARPFENFEFAACFADAVCAGLPPDDMRRATVTLLGVKLSRLQTLGLAGRAANEAVTDTIRDARIYLALLEAQSEA